MTKELREQMDALRQIGPKLNKASEDAARIIAEVESFLNGLHLGIAGRGECYKVESYLDPNVDPEKYGMSARRRTSSYLVYDRPGSGDFTIHVERDHSALELDPYGAWEFEPFETVLVTWNQCSRGERLKAFETLPSLLGAIFENAETSADAAEKATASIRETMTTLGIEPSQDAPPSRQARKPQA